jgi:hypothetical protein
MPRNRHFAPSTLPGDPPMTALPDLGDAFERIDRCRGLQSDWDGEGALPITEDVADRATTLLSRAAEEASRLGLQWENPAIAPSPDGALELSWEVEDRWVMLVVSLGPASIGCVVQEDDIPPKHTDASAQGAVQLVIWALLACRSEAPPETSPHP